MQETIEQLCSASDTLRNSFKRSIFFKSLWSKGMHVHITELVSVNEKCTSLIKQNFEAHQKELVDIIYF